jgi:hypothetical protein
MRLPDQVLNTVCFIAKSAAMDTYRATGFIVSVPTAHDNAHLYLVTAKHVARSQQKAWTSDKEKRAVETFLRLAGAPKTDEEPPQDHS